MSCILSIISGLLFSLNIYGQNSNLGNKISDEDSILLNNFWTDFKTVIETNDKSKLGGLCEFPFYCRACIDDTSLKHNDHITIRVTKKIFSENQYKLFFDKPIKSEVNKYDHFYTYIFHQTYSKKEIPNGFMFSYTIVAPSKTWEGSQGIIYLKKVKGMYKITGIDTVP